MSTSDEFSAITNEGDTKDGNQPTEPARTVREAIQAHGRDTVKTTFVQLIHDAVAGTGQPLEVAIRADMEGVVRRIGEAFERKFPGEFE